MESRKKRNLEIEKKVKQRKLMWNIGFVAALIVIVAAIGWVVWDTQSRQWIMTFEGMRIPTTDFRFFATSHNVPINEDTRPDIMADLMNTLMVSHRAEALGLGLTQEDMVELLEGAAQFRAVWEQFAPGALDFIEDERIAEIHGALGVLAERLMDHYVPYYPTDTPEFETGFQQWRDENEAGFANFSVMYLTGFSQEELEEVRYRAINEDVEFTDLVDAFGTNIDEHGIVWPMELDEFIEQFGLFEFEEELFNLEEGEWSRVLPAGFNYFLVYMDTRFIPEEDVLIEQYTIERRASIFVDILIEWVENANYRINNRVFNTIV